MNQGAEVLRLLRLLDPLTSKTIRRIKMAKRSSAKAITSKQSSAYKGVTRTAPAITAIDGSSRNQVGRSPRIKPLRSWTIQNNFVDEAMKDAQAEKQMNPHGYSRKKNPICSSCFVQKAVNGACGCNA